MSHWQDVSILMTVGSMYVMIWIKSNTINFIKYHYTPQTTYISAGIYEGKYHEVTSVYESLLCRIVCFDKALTILVSVRLTGWIHNYIRMFCKVELDRNLQFDVKIHSWMGKVNLSNFLLCRGWKRSWVWEILHQSPSTSPEALNHLYKFWNCSKMSNNWVNWVNKFV
jgi:hypothetical protein